VAVRPITDAASEDLLLRELPARVASDATVNRLKQTAGGNPLYLLELARAVGAGGQSADALPETLERVMAARIDQLPPAARRLIRDASVLGATFDRELASRVLDRPDLTDPAVWTEAFQDLVVVDGRTIRFGHDLVRVAAYEGLSVRRRKAVHTRAGEVIEAWGDAAPVADVVATLAFHATGSGIASRIVECNTRAADAAMVSGAMEVAERLLRDIIAAQRETRATRDDRRAILRQLASAAERAGHPDAALDAVRRASRLATGTERDEIAVDRVRVITMAGRYRAGLIATARALASCSDQSTRGHLVLARARIRSYLGQWKECLELAEELLADASTSADKRLEAQAHVLCEWCCSALGLPDRAAHAERAETLLIELDDSLGLGNLYLNRGISAWTESRGSEAVADFAQSSERYERAGDVLGAALADNNLAEVLTLQHRLDGAERLLVHARRVTEAANYPYGALTTVSGLSRIAAWRGDTGRALALQEEALAGFEDMGAVDLIADSLVRMVEIHLIAGEYPSALAVAERARQALIDLGDVPILPATLHRLRGRAHLALQELPQASREFACALECATRDQYPYEIALAEIGVARVEGDDSRFERALARLDAMGVLAPPPGT
jgi:tetratricopeptide (TPR) repeat protein